MAKFIVETDLGHDPDDFFALCHLITAGHELVAVSLVPGSPEQVRLLGFLRHITKQHFRIGVAKPDAKSENLGVHDTMLTAFRADKAYRPDGSSANVIGDALDNHPDAECLVIGPAKGFGKAVVGRKLGNLTFQGGFLPYSLSRPLVTLPKFEGQQSVGTFNFNGDRDAVHAILKADVSRRRFVGKNVCHTVVFDFEKFERLAPERDEASRLYRATMFIYLCEHKEKKLHDPTALACHLHPDIGWWYPGTPLFANGKWTTIPGTSDVLADVERELLWDVLLNWK